MILSIFDIIILGIIAISGLLGAYRGLVKFTIDLTTFVFSILGAYFLYPFLEIILSKYSDNEIIIFILSVILSYIAMLVSLSYLSNQLILIVAAISGGIIDRFLGCVAGIIRGVIISTIIFIFIIVFTCGSYATNKNLQTILHDADRGKYPEWLKNSKTTKYLESFEEYMMQIMPRKIIDLLIIPTNNLEDLEKSDFDRESLVDTIKKKPYNHDSKSDIFEKELDDLLN